MHSPDNPEHVETRQPHTDAEKSFGIVQSTTEHQNHPQNVRPFHKLKGNLDIDAILDRIAAGDAVAHIAREHGATPAALLYHLRSIPDYQAAREIGMEMRLDDGLEQIRGAANAGDLNLARVAEIHLRRTEWRAEREMAHRWGQRTHTTVEHTGDLADKLRQARERVIDTTSQRVTDVMSTDSEQPEPTHGGVQSSEDGAADGGRGTLR